MARSGPIRGWRESFDRSAGADRDVFEFHSPIPSHADTAGPKIRRPGPGRAEAFTALVERDERQIYWLASTLPSTRKTLRTYYAFLKAYRGLEEFRGDSKSYTWLVRFAVNESLVKLPKRKADRTLSLDEPVETEDETRPRQIVSWEENPGERYSREETNEILTRATQSLPFPYRAVFLLRDVEQLSTEETAAALNLSISAVKSRLNAGAAAPAGRTEPDVAQRGSTAPVHL